LLKKQRIAHRPPRRHDREDPGAECGSTGDAGGELDMVACLLARVVLTPEGQRDARLSRCHRSNAGRRLFGEVDRAVDEPRISDPPARRFHLLVHSE